MFEIEHPINVRGSRGSGLSDFAPLRWLQQGPWLQSAITFPSFAVALSWRSSLFLLGDPDSGHNTYIQHQVLLPKLLEILVFPSPVILLQGTTEGHLNKSLTPADHTLHRLSLFLLAKRSFLSCNLIT